TNSEQHKASSKPALHRPPFTAMGSIRSLFVRDARRHLSGQKLPLFLMPARLTAVVGACQGWVRWPRWRGLLCLGQRRTFVQLRFMFIRVFVGQGQPALGVTSTGGFFCARVSWMMVG